eukprot:SAG31_NODE_2720_length_5190_cov_3.678256_7_plen_193_part_00
MTNTLFHYVPGSTSFSKFVHPHIIYQVFQGEHVVAASKNRHAVHHASCQRKKERVGECANSSCLFVIVGINVSVHVHRNPVFRPIHSKCSPVRCPVTARGGATSRARVCNLMSTAIVRLGFARAAGGGVQLYTFLHPLFLVPLNGCRFPAADDTALADAVYCSTTSISCGQPECLPSLALVSENNQIEECST